MATLYVVATPIGNLGDLTPRAAETLRQVPVIAAESLARAKKLTSHLGLKGKRLISCREANRNQAAREVMEFLGQGLDVALISDAGTPGVSDPGAAVIAQAAQAGFAVSPLPGPSALAAALSVSGLGSTPFTFLGFLPAKPGARKRLIAQAAAQGWPLVLFEAPHRLAEAAADLGEVLGDRPVVLARELSKLHEEVAHTTLSRLQAQAQERQPKGEVTLVVAGGPPAAQAQARDQVEQLLRQGLREGSESPSHLARRVASQLSLPRDEVYQRLLAMKEEGPPESREPTAPEEDEDMDEQAEASMASEVPALPTLRRELQVANCLGLHARVAARIAQTVQAFQCQVMLAKDGLQADAASVLSILTLDAPQGSILNVAVQGPQADEALEALSQLFAAKFGEN